MDQLIHCSIALLISLFVNPSPSPQADAPNERATNQAAVVVFVCEHGAAKSVVAAAHFNKLAMARKIQARAIARGTNPDEAIAASAASGLEADGLPAGIERPRKLSASDLSGAIRVVAMCELPGAYSNAVRVERWDDVPSVSDDYGKARDALVRKIVRLLDELKLAKIGSAHTK